MQNSCGATLPPHSTCNLIVTFAPTATGPFTGQITATIQGEAQAQTVTLNGNGTAAQSGGGLQLSHSNIDFGTIDVGKSANGFSINASNTGATAIQLSSALVITGSNAFSYTGDCGMVIAAYSSCALRVNFAPTANGPVTGQLVFSPVGGTPQVIVLNGTGANAPAEPAPTLSLSPGSLNFSNVPYPGGWVASGIIVKNLSTSRVARITTTLSGSSDFSFPHGGCPATLDPGESCEAYIAYEPQSGATATGQLVVAVEGSSTPYTAGLNGSTVPNVTVTPASLDYGSMQAGSGSITQQVVVKQIINAQPITVTSLPASYGLVSQNCSYGSYNIQSCTLTFSLTAPAAGDKSEQIVLAVGSQALSIPVHYTATDPLPIVNPTSVDFGVAPVGGTSAIKYITVTNPSNRAMDFGYMANGPFQLADFGNCSTGKLPANGSCTIAVTASPSRTGTDSGNVTFYIDLNPYVVAMSVTGTQPARLAITWSSTSTFTSGIFDGGGTAVLIVQNTSSDTVPFNFVSSNAEFQVLSANCAGILAPGAQCIVSTAYFPSHIGVSRGEIAIIDTDRNSYISQPYTGTASRIAMSTLVSPSRTSLNFNSSIADAQSLMLTANTVIGGPVYMLSQGGPSTSTMPAECAPTGMAAGATCSQTITYTGAQDARSTGLILAITYDANPNLTALPIPFTAMPGGSATAGYSLAVYPTSLTLHAGQSGTAQFNFLPYGNFKGAVTLSCSGLPAGATCQFNPVTLAADGSNHAQLATLTITTTGLMASNRTITGMVLAFFPAGMMLIFRARRGRGAVPALLVALLSVVAMGAVGCGTGLSSRITPTGANTVTIKSTATATAGSASSGQPVTTTFTLNIIQ